MRVKITAIPKESTLPTNRVNPFSVPDEFKYGGALPSTGPVGNNRRIDTYSDFLRQPMKGTTYQESPYSHTGRELPEVPEGTPDAIVVEKQEQVIGDFNGDGMPVLMGVNTGTHKSKKDQRVSVPNNSFVFSDTPSLKIKDQQILDMFGMKKAATPAQIAKKYDLQKYKAILDDSDRGEMDKNTARMMYQNYTDKLNLLASIQEDKKMKQDQMKEGREYKKGGDVSLKEEQRQLQEAYPQGVLGANLIYGWPKTGSFVDGMEGPRTEFVRNFAGQQPIYNTPHEDIEPVPIYPSTGVQPPVQIPMNTIPVSGYTAKMGKEKKSKKEKGIKGMDHSLLNPDTLAAVTAGMRYAQYPDYNPIRQVAHAAIPNAVYLDPTRAKAAIQEGVNSATNAIAMGVSGPIARANVLALQGKAGTAAANIEAEYAQKNAEIANRTNEQAAMIYNQLWKDQQNYNKDYVEESHNAQMDKLGYQAATQNELLKQAYMAENRQRTAQNYNYINPYYTMDSRGYIYPKSEEQLEALRALDNRVEKSNNSNPFADVDAVIKQGKITDPDVIKELQKKAALIQYQNMQGPKMSRTYNPNTGMYGNTRYTGYEDAFENRMGGSIKKSKVKIVGLPSR